jgi:DNA topoisomerase-1
MPDPCSSDADPAPADDPEAVAVEHGLRYVSDAAPGIRRIRCGSGFRYVTADGETVRDEATKARIAQLVIPPAWTDVWICTAADGHLQATGRDARGRKQYRYHDRWREVRDADKFDRLGQFGEALGPLRRQVDEELTRPGALDREKVLALVVRLLDETLIRVGNAEYAATNDSYGLTTLGHEHVEIHGREVRFSFVGKGGVEHDVAVEDRRLARLVKRCHELGGQELFAWRDDGGRVVDVGSSDVNAWLRERTGEPLSAKEFRTWGATTVATEELARMGPPTTKGEAEAQVLAAIDAAAAQLGNTRAVCRASYVHPVVAEAHEEGRLHDRWARSRTTPTHRRAERTVLALLDEDGG